MERMAAEAVHEVPAHCTVEIKLGELHAGRNPLLLQQLRSISVQGATQYEVGGSWLVGEGAGGGGQN